MTVSAENFEDYSAFAEEPGLLEVCLDAGCAGLRLDQALVRMLPDYSRSRLQAWIKQGRVRLQGVPVTARTTVWGGECIAVEPELDPATSAFRPEAIPLVVVHEDASLIVIDKPAGLVVHPGSGNWSGTLLNALLHHWPECARVPRAGIVHRLDKDTSGLLVVAKTLTAQTDLVRQLQARTVRREYLALVRGVVPGPGQVDAPLGRHPLQRTRMAVVGDGKEAVTDYAIVERFPAHTLLRCQLQTGRTHQIRVHMQYAGYPLVGDPVYGGAPQRLVPALGAAVNGFGRQALHAARLGLLHPDHHEPLAWRAPVPDDLRALLLLLREDKAQQRAPQSFDEQAESQDDGDWEVLYQA